MHLGVTGTKNGITEAQFDIIKSYIKEDTCVTHFHHGNCKGADVQVALLYNHYHPDVWIIKHPPIKTGTQGNGPFHETREPKDYLERDKDNVNESDYLWACPDGKEKLRSGTWATVRYARIKGIPITIVMPDGNIIYE